MSILFNSYLMVVTVVKVCECFCHCEYARDGIVVVGCNSMLLLLRLNRMNRKISRKFYEETCTRGFFMSSWSFRLRKKEVKITADAKTPHCTYVTRRNDTLRCQAKKNHEDLRRSLYQGVCMYISTCKFYGLFNFPRAQ